MRTASSALESRAELQLGASIQLYRRELQGFHISLSLLTRKPAFTCEQKEILPIETSQYKSQSRSDQVLFRSSEGRDVDNSWTWR